MLGSIWVLSSKVEHSPLKRLERVRFPQDPLKYKRKEMMIMTKQRRLKRGVSF